MKQTYSLATLHKLHIVDLHAAVRYFGLSVYPNDPRWVDRNILLELLYNKLKTRERIKDNEAIRRVENLISGFGKATTLGSLLFAFSFTAFGGGDFKGNHSPHVAPGRAVTRGVASWYGSECAGLLQANAKPFDPSAMTCASYRFSLGERLRVTANGHSIVVVCSDRGPAKRLHRLIDLSEAAFAQIADKRQGTVKVTVERIK